MNTHYNIIKALLQVIEQQAQSKPASLQQALLLAETAIDRAVTEQQPVQTIAQLESIRAALLNTQTVLHHAEASKH